MKRNAFRALSVAAGILLMTLPARAHHSFAAAFDIDKPVAVTGVVTEVKLMNPHSFFWLDVTEPDGRVTRWGFEGSTPTSLMRSGYKRDAVKVGDKVTVKGSHARDASANMGAAREIVMQNGQSFIVGPKGNEPDANTR